MKTHYIVIHEYPLSPERTDHGVASSLYDTLDGAENQLDYCQSLQRRDFPGSEGRYYIATVKETDRD